MTMAGIREVAHGLRFPEGPVAMPDGSVLVVEVRGGTLSRVSPDGTVAVVANTGGGPNGAAIGPDGHVYICNNGGYAWQEGMVYPTGVAPDYTSGSIQRVDLKTGRVEVVYSQCEGRPLCAPNDLVFDATGGFWFTDFGHDWPRHRDRTGVFYARPDGSLIREVLFPLDAPNGVGLSPDGKRLYVAETHVGRVWAWELAGPGEIAGGAGHGTMNGKLLAGLPGLQFLDSLAVDSAGNVCVATIWNGGITVISPDGGSIEHVPMPDPVTTNICFGGPDLRTAYITLTSTGRLVATEWPRPGLKLNF